MRRKRRPGRDKVAVGRRGPQVAANRQEVLALGPAPRPPRSGSLTAEAAPTAQPADPPPRKALRRPSHRKAVVWLQTTLDLASDSLGLKFQSYHLQAQRCTYQEVKQVHSRGPRPTPAFPRSRTSPWNMRSFPSRTFPGLKASGLTKPIHPSEAPGATGVGVILTILGECSRV